MSSWLGLLESCQASIGGALHTASRQASDNCGGILIPAIKAEIKSVLWASGQVNTLPTVLHEGAVAFPLLTPGFSLPEAREFPNSRREAPRATLFELERQRHQKPLFSLAENEKTPGTGLTGQASWCFCCCFLVGKRKLPASNPLRKLARERCVFPGKMHGRGLRASF